MSEPEISLLICDDHQILTDALAAVVASEPGVRMVASPVDNGGDAVALTVSHRPDVVLMDIELHGPVSGIEATRQIRKLSPQTKVLVVSGHRRPTVMVEAIEAGAVGFIDKGTAMATVLQGVRDVAAGKILIDPVRLAALMPALAAERRSRADTSDRFARLTQREHEILGMLAEGVRNDAIARLLSISVATVRTHTSNILAKLGVHSQLEAVALVDRHDDPST